jgi:hypothetical protein
MGQVLEPRLIPLHLGDPKLAVVMLPLLIFVIPPCHKHPNTVGALWHKAMPAQHGTGVGELLQGC